MLDFVEQIGVGLHTAIMKVNIVLFGFASPRLFGYGVHIGLSWLLKFLWFFEAVPFESLSAPAE